jgi:SAM-dependent methyltransferase
MIFRANVCVCGAESSEMAFEVADWNFGNFTETGIMRRCISCGSLFPDKFPTDEFLGNAYSNYYTAAKYKKSRIRECWRAFLRLARGISSKRHLPARAKTVLDYGCGSGTWLVELKKKMADMDLYGTDIAKPTIKQLPFKWIEPEAIRKCERVFDFITLCHVVEHLKEPREAIEFLRNCLAPEGTLWIATPNADSYLFDFLAGRSRDADFPRHRQIFSRQLLLDMLDDVGLTCEFKPSPRINTILNLTFSLSNRNKNPKFGKNVPNIGFIVCFIQTVKHLIKNDTARMQNDPEIILIARRKI